MRVSWGCGCLDPTLNPFDGGPISGGRFSRVVSHVNLSPNKNPRKTPADFHFHPTPLGSFIPPLPISFTEFYRVLYWGFTEFYGICLGSTEFYRVSRCLWLVPGFAEFDWVLPSLTGFYLVLLGLTGFCHVLRGFTDFYSEFEWVLVGFIVFLRWLLGFTGFYWVFLGFTVFFWVVLGFTGFLLGFYWVFTGFYWVLPWYRLWLSFRLAFILVCLNANVFRWEHKYPKPFSARLFSLDDDDLYWRVDPIISADDHHFLSGLLCGCSLVRKTIRIQQIGNFEDEILKNNAKIASVSLFDSTF